MRCSPNRVSVGLLIADRISAFRVLAQSVIHTVWMVVLESLGHRPERVRDDISEVVSRLHTQLHLVHFGGQRRQAQPFQRVRRP